MAEKIGGGRVLQMGLFHYNSLKVCLLSLQYNPVGVGTFFFFFSPGFCMSALPVLLMAPPTAGTLGQKHGKKMRPAARVIIYMPISASASVASGRGHYRRNREGV